MAKIARKGYGQVEPNHLSAQRTAQIYAQLPAKEDIKVLENGQFVKYDYKEGVCNFTGAGEWMLVFNEVKLYDQKWRETYKDFAMKKEDYVDGVMVPRVFKTNVGDIYTTNCVDAQDELSVGSVLSPKAADGILSLTGDGSIQFQVVKIYTLADGQAAVKVMRIA